MRSTSTYSLNELNLIDPEKADIVNVTHLFEESTVTETNKLLDFDVKAQVILKQYEANLEDQTNTAEVVQVLMQNGDNVIVQEYVNGELNIEQTVEELKIQYTMIKCKDQIKNQDVLLIKIHLTVWMD